MATLPPIYWINLARSKERSLRMRSRLDGRHLAHVRVDAIDGRDESSLARRIQWSREISEAAPACWRRIDSIEAAVVASHLAAIKQAYDDGHEQALVFEDDVTFELLDRWPEGWETLQRQLPKDFGIVQLCVACDPVRLDKLFSRQELLVRSPELVYASAAAYLVQRAAMRVLLDAFDRGSHFDISARSAPSEYVLFGGPVLWSGEFSGPFVSRIPLFMYEGDDSEITDTHNDYLRPSRAFVERHFSNLVAGTYKRLLRDPAPPIAPAPMPKLEYQLSRAALAVTPMATHRRWFGKATLLSPMSLALRLNTDASLGYRLGYESFSPEPHVGTFARRTAWLRTEDLPSFASAVLPRLRRPIALITHSNSGLAPGSNPTLVDRIVQSGRVSQWLSTHAYQESSDFIEPLPLGIVHAPHQLDRERRFDTAAEQEQRLAALVGETLDLGDRMPLAVLEPPRDGSRRPLPLAVSYAIAALTQEDYWRAIARHAVFVAPLDGSDTHAIWYALLFGCIIAAPRWRRQQALSDARFVWFDDLEEIDARFIARAIARYEAAETPSTNPSILSLDAWLRRAQS